MMTAVVDVSLFQKVRLWIKTTKEKSNVTVTWPQWNPFFFYFYIPVSLYDIGMFHSQSQMMFLTLLYINWLLTKWRSARKLHNEPKHAYATMYTYGVQDILHYAVCIKQHLRYYWPNSMMNTIHKHLWLCFALYFAVSVLKQHMPYCPENRISRNLHDNSMMFWPQTAYAEIANEQHDVMTRKQIKFLYNVPSTICCIMRFS